MAKKTAENVWNTCYDGSSINSDVPDSGGSPTVPLHNRSTAGFIVTRLPAGAALFNVALVRQVAQETLTP